MQNFGTISKIKTPILIGGLFSAFIWFYFTPISTPASTLFLPFYIDQFYSAKKQATQQRQGIKNETIYFAHRHYFGDI